MTDKIARILDIPVKVTAVLGRTEISLKDILEFGKGSIVELDTIKDEEVKILVNGKPIAYGQVVIVEQNFGIKITSILEEEELVKSLG